MNEQDNTSVEDIGEMRTKAPSLPTTAIAKDNSLDADYPCPDPRCNDSLGAMPLPQCVTAVAWAEEAAKVADALRGLLNVIEADELIPDSASYMRQAREVMEHWPEIPELPVPPFPATQESKSSAASNNPNDTGARVVQHLPDSESSAFVRGYEQAREAGALILSDDAANARVAFTASGNSNNRYLIEYQHSLDLEQRVRALVPPDQPEQKNQPVKI